MKYLIILHNTQYLVARGIGVGERLLLLARGLLGIWLLPGYRVATLVATRVAILVDTKVMVPCSYKGEGNVKVQGYG